MSSAISAAGAMPPFAKVKRYLKAGLVEGRWPPGALMPSEAELVTQLKVSRMTINRALRELQVEGLVERVQGVGTFAAHPNKMASSLAIRDLHQEIEANGHSHRSVVLLAASVAADDDIALQLGVAIGATVFHTRLVHFENGVELQLEDRHVNPACAPDYLAQDFTRITPTAYLLQVCPYVEAQFRIEAAGATAQEAQWLGIQPNEACLVVFRRTTRMGHAGRSRQIEGITTARLVHPGSRYSLQGTMA